MELFFDTETSGFINKNLPANHPKQSWIMQLAIILGDKNNIYTELSTLISSDGRKCHPSAQKIHGISVEKCDDGGLLEKDLSDLIFQLFKTADLHVAHNISFDMNFIDQYLERNGYSIESFSKIPIFCTMKSSTDLCKLPGKFGKFKWPKLTELYQFLFNEEFSGAHSAMKDVRATRRCYYKLKNIL